MLKAFTSVALVFSLVCLSKADDAMLIWSNGDSLNGQLLSADEKVLTWQSSLFVEPLQISLPALTAVGFSKSGTLSPHALEYRILMQNGDVLFGQLKSISDKTFGFEGVRLGAFEVARDQVLSLQRAKNTGGVIYAGPRGLEGWIPAFRRVRAEDNVGGMMIQMAAPAMAVEAVEEAAPAEEAKPVEGAVPAPAGGPDGAAAEAEGAAVQEAPAAGAAEPGAPAPVAGEKAADEKAAPAQAADEPAPPEAPGPAAVAFAAVGVPLPMQAEQNAQKPEKSQWTESADGSLSTTVADAALFLPLALPEKYEIELELHSKKTLSFVLAIGRDAKSGLRLESWIDVLVAANGTKFATLQQIPQKEQTLHVHLYVNQAEKKMSVYSRGGDKLGEVSTAGLRGGVEGITLRNGEWDLALRKLRISHWDGSEPQPMPTSESQIYLADRSVRSGRLQSFKPETGLVTIVDGTSEVDVPLDQISVVVLSGDKSPENSERGPTQLVCQDGCYVSGSLRQIAEGIAVIKTIYSDTPISCSLTGAIRLGFTPVRSEETQSDRLFHAKGSLQGSLVVDGEAEIPIQWKPLGGLNASGLKNGGDARFVRGKDVTHFSEQPEMLANFPDVLYLKNNDVLPCRIESCGEDSIQLQLPFSEARSIPREEVRAVELAATGRIHQKGFGAPGWKGNKSKKAETSQLTFKGNASVSHPSILTGDTVRFQLSWPIQSYANLTVSLFGSGSRKDTESTHVSFSMMQATLQVLDRPPAQDQMFFRGFGGQNSETMIRAPEGKALVQLVARDGKLLISIDGKQVKAIPLNPAGAGSRGIAFNANVTMMGNVVVNGRVQQGSGDAVVISEFEIDNLSGASVRQFIEEEARQAALTIPRFRRDNPPTHVLVAANGDLLRGRLLAVREKDIQFESRLETMRIDRQRVAAIVWLDPAAKNSGAKKPKDQKQDPEAKAPAADTADSSDDSESGFVLGDEEKALLQAQLADGFRITMAPERLVNGQIKGHSRLLGEATFPAATIRELFVGDLKNQQHSPAYEQWIAKNAQEPDWDVAASDGGSSAGAAMIGTQAEDFELPLLDGSRFRLSDHADKIIVLDFWATWCGPCVAALPDYIAATSEFEESKVIFVAVNQQEASDQIRGFLEQRNLSPTVALDRDGLIGQKFQVSGIPHTVILGKGNIVEDVHVGYQQGGGESMQIAIQQLLDGTWKRPDSKGQPPADPQNPKEPESI